MYIQGKEYLQHLAVVPVSIKERAWILLVWNRRTTLPFVSFISARDVSDFSVRSDLCLLLFFFFSCWLLLLNDREKNLPGSIQLGVILLCIACSTWSDFSVIAGDTGIHRCYITVSLLDQYLTSAASPLNAFVSHMNARILTTTVFLLISSLLLKNFVNDWSNGVLLRSLQPMP